MTHNWAGSHHWNIRVIASLMKVLVVVIASFLLGLSALDGVIGRGYSFTYLLDARHVECFHERLVNGSLLEVDYQVKVLQLLPICHPLTYL